ncbi:MAG: dUTP diphosphatase [Nitrospinae bacterium]|nr:dUTP diphosphatase [Nitrospinota bacterium]
MFHLKVKKLHPDARIPASAHPGDLGCDLFSLEPVTIPHGGQALVRTGVALKFPDGWGGIVKDRSSMAVARIYTAGGVIDAGYRGEVKIILRNESGNDYSIKAGDKIAQIVPLRAEQWVVDEVPDLDDTTRSSGGFGSTGPR